MTHIAPDTRANARRLRTDMTAQEHKLWSKLREVNRMLGLHFRRQAPIGRYIADFADYGRRTIIEVDGSGHGGPRDAHRDAWLTAQGFTILRFRNTEVDVNIDGVMQMVLDALDAAPPPQPSPTGGEGGTLPPALAQADHPGASPPPRGEGLGVGGRAPSAGNERGEGDAVPPSRAQADHPRASPPPRGEGPGVGGLRAERVQT